MYLIGNGRLYSRDETRPYIENGAVLTEGNKIIAVGTTEELQKNYPNATFIDAKQQLIMPAFTNVHNHIYSAFARGLAIKNYAPKNFIDILEGLWWNLDDHLTLDNTKYSAQATYINCIENGVTTIFDHHASYGQIKGSLMAIANEAKAFGIRSCLCYEISDRRGEAKMKEAVQENVDFIQYANDDDSGLIKGMMGLHASFTLSDETLRYCESKRPEGVGYHVHIAEGPVDEEDCVAKYGMRVAERFEKFGILGPKSLAGHCIYVNDHEMEILKNTGTAVIHNPESNMGNAVGCPDVIKLFAKGIDLGLGTDGYTNDVMESYKVANVLQKHFHQNPDVAWVEIPTMLFDNNHQIANRYFDIPLGKLKEGYAADIILVDYLPLTPMDVNNLNSHMLFGVNGSMVTTTIGNGKLLMQDRKLINIDKEAVLKECRNQAAGLWHRVNERR